MNKHLPKVKIFDPKYMMKLAARHVTVFNNRVTKKAEDAEGDPLPEYSDSYQKLLRKDFKKKDGSRYKGYQGYSLTTGGDKIARRPFRLRGLTMRNLKARKAGSDYYEIGWTGNPALIVQGNKDRDENPRDIISDIPDKEWQWVLRQLGKGLDKEWAKLKNVKIKVG